jgi:hypothetical protein
MLENLAWYGILDAFYNVECIGGHKKRIRWLELGFK